MRTYPAVPVRVPPDIWAWLKARASANRRSLTGELAVILEQQRRAEQPK